MKKQNGEKPKDVKEDKPTRADFHHGSTTQGGSNFGQGSADIGNDDSGQGEETSDGSNYGNERGWNNEALRREDIDVSKKDRPERS
ncbi:MAG TPA: hypothetical protein VMH27_20505 [Puia sp.]|nr:hypothetical protein [Puia sp.]